MYINIDYNSNDHSMTLLWLLLKTCLIHVLLAELLCTSNFSRHKIFVNAQIRQIINFRGKNFVTAAELCEALPICELQLRTYMRCTACAHNIIIFVNGGLITKFTYCENLELYGTSKYLSLLKISLLLRSKNQHSYIRTRYTCDCVLHSNTYK